MIIKLNLQLRKICLLYTDAIKWNDNIKCKKYVDNVEIKYINREIWGFFYSWKLCWVRKRTGAPSRAQSVGSPAMLVEKIWKSLIGCSALLSSALSLFSFQSVLCFSNGWTTSDDVRQNWHKIEGEIGEIAISWQPHLLRLYQHLLQT